MPTLYSFRRCPYAIRARMALRQAGMEVRLHEVDLRDRPPSLLLASPKGTVPVLVLPDGRVIDQSLDIMGWALLQNDPDGWLDAGTDTDAEHWIGLNDGVFKGLLDRYKYADRHPAVSREVHRTLALEAFVAPLDRRLRQSMGVCGEHTSMADVALFPFVRQFAMVDKAWFDAAPLPGVQAWLNRWMASDLFASVMKKPAL